MSSYAFRALSVTFCLMALVKGYPAASKGSWPVVVDSVATVLIAVVMWFVAVAPGAVGLKPPVFGTRALRLVLYGSILGLSMTLVFPQVLGAAQECPTTLTPLVAVALLVPFIQADLRPERRGGDARV